MDFLEQNLDIIGFNEPFDASTSTKTLLLPLQASYAPQFVFDVNVFANVSDFQTNLEAFLESFLDRDCKISQKYFWRIFEGIESSKASVSQTLLHEIAHAAVTWGVPRNPNPKKLRAPAIVAIDGQHRLVAYKAPIADLSARKIRTVFRIALTELSAFEDARTNLDVLAFLSSSLKREITKRIRWKEIAVFFVLNCTVPSTRERVLGFVLRTGNSPPHLGESCPVECWAIVTVTQARSEDYEAIQGSEISSNLRGTICEQHSATRFRRRSQGDANNCGGPKPARHWRARLYHPLAQCA
jgi:hypothetical protein